jgi:hypothetical protein
MSDVVCMVRRERDPAMRNSFLQEKKRSINCDSEDIIAILQ